MFYIKLDEDRNLVTTMWEPIYRGDHMNQKIIYLIPTMVDNIDMADASVYLNTLRVEDGEPDIIILERLEDLYKDSYYQYTFPVTSRLSRKAGEIITWMHISSGVFPDSQVAKTGENTLYILESKDMDEFINAYAGGDDGSGVDEVLTALHQLNENIEAVVSAKADNIMFDKDNSTIRLVANGEPIGDTVFVNTSTGRLITDIRLTANGEMLVFFDDDSILNLGVVVGTDGKIYIPHIDEHNVLTFTIGTETEDVPDPVALNASEEWGNIGE